MAVKRISKEAEGRLLNCVDRVMAAVEATNAPSAAVVKAARGADLTPHQTQLLIQAYNNARHNLQRRSGQTPEEKTAYFPLAEPHAVFAELYPDIKEAAAQAQTTTVAADYQSAPRPIEQRLPMEKAAQAPAPPRGHAPEYFPRKAWSLFDQVQRTHAANRSKVAATLWNADRAVDGLVDHFRQAVRDRQPFPDVRAAAEALFGKAAAVVCDHLIKLLPGLAKEAASRLPAPVARHRPPYSLIETCLAEAEAHRVARDEHADFAKKAAASVGQLTIRLVPVPVRHRVGSILCEKKAADDLIDIANPLASGVSKALGQEVLRPMAAPLLPVPKEKLEQKTLLGLLDPEHDAKLRQIRAQAVFEDLRSDPFLSAEKPERLARLYNEVVQMAPRLADQPLAMRAVLRRYVAQGQVDPHEIGQLAELETRLKDRDRPELPARLPGESGPEKGK